MRRFILTGSVFALLLAVPASARAQQMREVSGRVTVAGAGTPLADVSVGVVGQLVGTRTNDKGEYRLRVPAGVVALMTRQLGYKRQQRTLGPDESVANFELERDVLMLEGVTVTGAATTVDRQTATSAVSSVNSEQLNRAPSVSIENALQGKVLGASINMNNGAPGGGAQIQIRGPSSLLGRIDPLVVLDGVVIANDVRSNRQSVISSSLNSGEENGTNRLADINPQDIESVEVLKGSVASAIYGSQATNGVVVITTKRGRSGSPRFSMSQRVGTYSLLNNKGSRHFNSLDEVLAVPTVAGNAAGEAAAASACTASSCPYYDYVGELFGRKDLSWETTASMSGGIESTKYFASLRDQQEAGTAMNTGARHQSLRVNLDQAFGNKLTIALGSTILRSFAQRGLSNNDNTQSSPLYAFAYTPGVLPLNQKQADGSYMLNPFGYGPENTTNPFQTYDLLRNNEDVFRLIGNVTANYNAFSSARNDVRFNGVFGVDRYQNEGYQFAPANLQGQMPGSAKGTYPGTAIVGTGDELLTNGSLSGVWEVRPSWFTSRFSATASFQNTWNNDFNVIGRGLIPTVTSASGMVNTTTTNARSRVVNQAYNLAEDVTMLDERLLVSLAVRGEKSSVNGDRDKYYTFPRFGASYRWMQPLGGIAGITEIKFRGTVGQSGLQPRYAEREVVFATGGQIGGQNGLVQSGTIGNPNIKPELTTESEGGLDIGFWRDRGRIEATYYDKNTRDLLVRPLLAPSSGVSQTVVNGGKMRTAGTEVGLTIVPIQNSMLTWTSHTAYQQMRSRIVSFPDRVLPFRLGAEGGFGTAYGRLFFTPGKSTSAIYGNAVVNGVTVRDTILGDANPDFTMAFNNTLTWGNFDFSSVVDWRRGGTVSSLTLNLYDEGNNTWDYTDASPEAGVPLGQYRYDSWDGGSNTSFYLMDGSFVKVRELTLSYSVPSSRLSALSRFGVRGARVSVSGRNLFMFTDYNGYDPEVNNGGQVVARFVDLAPFPSSRSYFLTLGFDF